MTASVFAGGEPHQHAAMSVPAGASAAATSGAVAWDEAASASLAAELHRLHEIWNKGDIESLKEYVIGDSRLPTFELDPSTHQPIKLDSKAAIDGFVNNVIKTQDSSGLVTELDEPKVSCRATSTFGICTEECSVKYKHTADGEVVAVDKLWSTQIAVMTDRGWRWVQWHMSDARPPRSPLVR